VRSTKKVKLREIKDVSYGAQFSMNTHSFKRSGEDLGYFENSWVYLEEEEEKIKNMILDFDFWSRSKEFRGKRI
jgi:hypothetical protein